VNLVGSTTALAQCKLNWSQDLKKRSQV